MAPKSRRKVIGRLTQSEYGLLRELTDDQALDAASLEAAVGEVVEDRFRLAKGMIEAAGVLAGSQNELVRRSAISRSYYGAYHAARATVFAIRRRDEDDHEELPKLADAVLDGRLVVGDTLTELKRLRREADYSPYPGPSAETEYETAEIERLIGRAVQQASEMVETLERHLRDRR